MPSSDNPNSETKVKTKEQIENQSRLLQAARLLGATYTEDSNGKHTLTTSCGILLLVSGAKYPDEIWQVQAFWPHHSGEAVLNVGQRLEPLAICRRIQAYCVGIAYKWDKLQAELKEVIS
jgi:hypothetical protein